MDEYACEIGRYKRTQGVKQSVCLSFVVLSLSARKFEKTARSIGIRATPMNDTDIDIYHLKCCVASSTAKCGGPLMFEGDHLPRHKLS